MLASCSWHRHWVACNSNTTSFFAIQIALVDVDLFKFNSIPICQVLGFPKLLNLGSGLKGVLDHIFIISKACWKTKVWSCSGVLFPKPALLPAPSLPLPWPCPALTSSSQCISVLCKLYSDSSSEERLEIILATVSSLPTST